MRRYLEKYLRGKSTIRWRKRRKKKGKKRKRERKGKREEKEKQKGGRVISVISGELAVETHQGKRQS